MTTINLIKQWVRDRNLHTQDPRIQMSKLMEEVGELANCVNKNKLLGAMDGVGDSVVVLVCLCEQLGINFEDCVSMAYEEIKDRKGKLVNGTFVKEEDLV